MTHNPFVQEQDPELVVKADGSLETPIKRIESVDEAIARLPADPHQLAELLLAMKADNHQ